MKMIHKIKKPNNLKALGVETVVFVLLFGLLGTLLLFEQKGYRAVTNTSESTLIDEDRWYEVKNENAGAVAANAPECLVLRSAGERYSRRLSENIVYTLNSLNVNVSVKDFYIAAEPDPDDPVQKNRQFSIRGTDDPTVENTEAEKTADESAADVNDAATKDSADAAEQPTVPEKTVIPEIDYQSYDEIAVCFSDISVMEQDIEKLGAWLNGGGHLIFAGGLDEKTDLAKWSDILGTEPEQEAAPVLADSLRFNTDLLAGTNDREFSDDVISGEVLEVAVRKDCTVHISTAEETPVPLLWERKSEKGQVFVCNADLMEAKNDRGIIAAVHCRFYPVYAYPVINASVYCIDDCPSPIPAGYEKNVVAQYGYTVGDFYANVWMPSMQRIADEYGIKYSTFAVQTYDNNTSGEFGNTDNRESAAYYASLILNMGGEVGIHGYNHQPLVLEGYKFDKENEGYTAWPNVMSMLESVKSVIKYTEGLTDDLYVEAYVAPSNVLSNEALTEMISQIENLRIYAGVYTGTADQLVQEYKVLSNGVVYCPRLTADMQMEDSEWWTQLNELNYHYIESNFIHPDDILDEQRSDGGDFDQMLSGYRQMIEWNRSMGLRDTTISECGAAVQRYCNLNYTQNIDGDTMTLKLDGLIDTAYMMVRTNGKKIVSVDGGEVSECSDNVYILEAKSPEITIKTVEKNESLLDS